MNLQQLITFSTVISEGSMTAAADKLYLTQPAVSQQIRHLEDEMGVALLDRGSRNAKPTVQGQLLYDYAKRIIALTQQAQIAVQTMGEGVKGELRIGTLNSLGLQYVSPVVAQFLKHNAKTNIDLLYDSGVAIIALLEQGKLDAAILPDMGREYSIEAGRFTARTLVRDEFWFVTSGKDAGLPTEVELKDLGTRPFLRLTERYDGFDRLLTQKLDEAGVKFVSAFSSNNVGTLKRLIENGLGWGFLPAHAIRKQVRMGRLTAIDIPEMRYSTSINFYVRAQDGNEQMIEVFYRSLKQQGLGQ